jgi:hypothetical protein
MTTLLEQFDELIADGLQRCTAQVRAVGGGWEFSLGGGSAPLGTARLGKKWLGLRLPVAEPSSAHPAPGVLDRMLATNGQLSGGAKCTLADDLPLPCLSAEIFWDDEAADIATRISQACDGFRQALDQFAGEWGWKPRRHRRSAKGNKNNIDEAAQLPRDEEGPGEQSLDLAALCKEQGWPVAERAGGRLVVELDVPGSFCQALGQLTEGGGLHLGVEVASAPSIDDDVREALSVVLLHAGHSVQMVRPTLRQADNGTAYGWEVVLDHVGGGRELGAALAALSAACRLSVREVSAFLQDPSLARAYLALRGWRS